MRFLLFTLYAPICSLGEIAVGERRMGWTRPGRSAVLGLVAAATGTKRNDENAHRKLETGLYYAVRTDAPGHPFIDYHTAQTPKARPGQKFSTRHDELSDNNLNTVLSFREWRANAYFTTALWLREGSAVDLDSIERDLRHPQFILYLGRKSAPLGLPLLPTIIEAENFITAFDQRQPDPMEKAILDRHRINFVDQPEIAFDHDVPNPPTQVRIEHRRDAIISRQHWLFSDRLERIHIRVPKESKR